AQPLPRAHPARPGIRVVPRRPGRPDDQAAGLRAGRRSGNRLRGGGSGRAARRARAGFAIVRGVSGEHEAAPVLTERRGRDLIVAARGARLGIPEVKRSLVAAGGALLRLPRALPRNVANELALTGDPIEAERAHELGLVNRLAEPGQALDVAVQLAEAIAAN